MSVTTGHPPDDFAFGGGGFCKIYGDRLADSSLLDCAVATRWTFMYMLARADSLGRFRCATVAGLARAAAVSLPEAEAAIRELETPDPDSSSPEDGGRRILRIAGGWQIVTYAKYRDYQTKRQRAEAERKRRQRATTRQESGTCPGTSQGHPHETTNNKLQTTDNGERSGGAPKGTGASTARELKSLAEDPAVADVADHWLRQFKRPRRELGVLRAARTALAGGYALDLLKLVIRVTAIARESPERFPERGSIRWAVEHGKAVDPSYLLRPSTLDRLIGEVEEWDRA